MEKVKTVPIEESKEQKKPSQSPDQELLKEEIEMRKRRKRQNELKRAILDSMQKKKAQEKYKPIVRIKKMEEQKNKTKMKKYEKELEVDFGDIMFEESKDKTEKAESNISQNNLVDLQIEDYSESPEEELEF